MKTTTTNPVKKAVILSVLATGGLAVLTVRTFAILGVGDIVYDPISNGTQITNFAKELGQWAQNFTNQMTQIRQLVTQVQQFASYLQAFPELTAFWQTW